MVEIYINSKKYTIQDADININEKYIEFNLDDADDEFHKYIMKYFWSEVYMISHIDLSYTDIVSIYNCYFAVNKNIVTLRFDTAIIGMQSKDFDKERSNCIYAKINYLKYNMVDIEEFIKNNNEFIYRKYHYSITINFIPRCGIIKIEYKNNISVEKLTKEFLEFFEFICFICGCYFEIKELYYTVNDNEIKRILNLNSKYDIKKKNLHTNKVIIDYVSLDLKEAYSKWRELRESTHLILDLYESLMENHQFYEVSLAILINCMEGYMKSIHAKEILKLKNTKLDTILEGMYFSTSNSKIVMNDRERKKYNIYEKLGIHRNYFDHLDRVQDSFKGKTCRYILLKCDLLFRLYILADLKIPIIVIVIGEGSSGGALAIGVEIGRASCRERV